MPQSNSKSEEKKKKEIAGEGGGWGTHIINTIIGVTITLNE